jgi:methionine sulfoxide reductase heme-binding subunit
VNVLWVLSRATGLVSLVRLTLMVVLGVAVTRRGRPRRGGRLGARQLVLVGLHRNTALLALLVLATHIGTVVADSYVNIRWYDTVVPFVGTYKSFWLGLGTLSLDIGLLLVVTSLVRHRLPRRLWRGVHLLAYLAWPVALVHSVGIGTDMRSAPGLLLAGICALVGTGAVLWRMSARPALPVTERAPDTLTTLRAERARGRQLVTPGR